MLILESRRSKGNLDMPENQSETSSPRANFKLKDNSEFRESSQYREIRGVWEAIQYVRRVSKDKRKPINESTVKNIHQKVLGYFHPEVTGQYRDFDVEITDARFLPPHWSNVPEKMRVFGHELEWKAALMNRSLNNLSEIISTGAWAHYRIVRIHPFADGNGRTARLLTDLIFKRAGLYYITDWGAKNDSYLDALNRVVLTNDLGHFETFLADKLAARHQEILTSIDKGSVSMVARGSIILSDIKNRHFELQRIVKSKTMSKNAISV